MWEPTEKSRMVGVGRTSALWAKQYVIFASIENTKIHQWQNYRGSSFLGLNLGSLVTPLRESAFQTPGFIYFLEIENEDFWGDFRFMAQNGA